MTTITITLIIVNHFTDSTALNYKICRLVAANVQPSSWASRRGLLVQAYAGDNLKTKKEGSRS